MIIEPLKFRILMDEFEIPKRIFGMFRSNVILDWKMVFGVVQMATVWILH